jgi:myosin-crossreactive antigen
MEETLKILVDRFQKGLLTTPNIQVTNMRVSDEVLDFTDDDPNPNIGRVINFERCLIKKSQLTRIKISNGNFEVGFCTESTLENCTFESTNFQE